MVRLRGRGRAIQPRNAPRIEVRGADDTAGHGSDGPAPDRKLPDGQAKPARSGDAAILTDR